MFGAVAVMVDDAMAVAAYQDGSLLVRVDPTDDPRLLQRPDVSRAEMGAGRYFAADIVPEILRTSPFRMARVIVEAFWPGPDKLPAAPFHRPVFGGLTSRRAR